LTIDGVLLENTFTLQICIIVIQQGTVQGILSNAHASKNVDPKFVCIQKIILYAVKNIIVC